MRSGFPHTLPLPLPLPLPLHPRLPRTLLPLPLEGLLYYSELYAYHSEDCSILRGSGPLLDLSTQASTVLR